MTTTTDNPDSYWVSVSDSSNIGVRAFIGPAKEKDLPTKWECDWPNIWGRADFDCQAVIKLSVNGDLWGLMSYGLYPYPAKPPNLQPKLLILEHLETHPGRRIEKYRFRPKPPPAPSPYINPVGKWLVWHACETALDYCGIDRNPLLLLDATVDAVDYYRDVIGMKMTEGNNSRFGEESYAFSFDGSSAKNFCDLQKRLFGCPQKITRQ